MTRDVYARCSTKTCRRPLHVEETCCVFNISESALNHHASAVSIQSAIQGEQDTKVASAYSCTVGRCTGSCDIMSFKLTSLPSLLVVTVPPASASETPEDSPRARKVRYAFAVLLCVVCMIDH